MDFSTFVRSRLATLGRGQKDLARAARVTDSYVSQLLNRKKMPPAPDRTDLYERMGAFLQLEPGELARLAGAERVEQIRQRLGSAPEPLFQEFRELVLAKCRPERREAVRAVFVARPFGTLEQLVARALLEVVQDVARSELDREDWIRLAARIGGRSREEMRVLVLDFLDQDVSQVTRENCALFLDPLLESWDVDLVSHRLDIVLNRDLVADAHRRFAFVEQPAESDESDLRGLADLLSDPELGGDVTDAELRFLRSLRLDGRQPNKLFFYRALQVLRDPVHFRSP